MVPFQGVQCVKTIVTFGPLSLIKISFNLNHLHYPQKRGAIPFSIPPKWLDMHYMHWSWFTSMWERERERECVCVFTYVHVCVFHGVKTRFIHPKLTTCSFLLLSALVDIDLNYVQALFSKSLCLLLLLAVFVYIFWFGCCWFFAFFFF